MILRSARGRAAVLGVAAVLVVALMVVWALYLPPPDPDVIRGWVRDAGWAAPVIAVVVFVVLAQAMVPTSVLNIAFGIAFGALWGSLLVWVSAMIAATIGFWVVRRLKQVTPARTVDDDASPTAGFPKAFDPIKRLFVGYPTFAVGAARALGILPFGPTNYALGATTVPWPAYVVGTGVGIVPGTIANVTVGAYSGQPQSPWLWAGVAATIVLLSVGVLWHRRSTSR